jgi:hypothetical protein
MKCRSDIENPCDFFLCFITKEQLLNYYNSFRESYRVHPGYNSESETVLDYDFDQITKEFSFLKPTELTSLFEQKVNSILSMEVESSIKHIENYYIQCEGNFVKFKTYIDKKVRSKLTKLFDIEIHSKYPYIFKHINELIEKINTYFPLVTLDYIEEVKSNSPDIFSNPITLNEKIDAIFSFAYKEKSTFYNQPFISNKDYNLFKDSLIKFLEGKEFALSEKIEFKGLANNELNYLFYIIKNINGIRPKLRAKDWFVFAHNILFNYTIEHKETFERKLKSTLTLNDHPYLPQFVRSYYLRN